MDIQVVIHALAPPILGASIGYLTNMIAIKMLFKPYNVWRVWKIRIPFTPGVIPKHREEIAQNIATLVSQFLLNKETIHAQVTSPTSQALMRTLLTQTLKKIRDTDYPSLLHMIPQDMHSSFMRSYTAIKANILQALRQWIQGESCRELIDTLSQTITHSLQTETLDTLTQRFNSSPAQICDDFLQKLTQNHTLAHHLQTFWDFLATSSKQAREYVPQALLNILFEHVQRELPNLIIQFEKKFFEAGLDKDIHKNITKTIYGYLNKLNTFQQLVASAWGVEERIEKDLLPIIQESIRGIFSELRTQDTQHQSLSSIIQSVEKILSQPLHALFSNVTDLKSLEESLSGKLTAYLTQSSNRASLAHKLTDPLKKLPLDKVLTTSSFPQILSTEIHQLLHNASQDSSNLMDTLSTKIDDLILRNPITLHKHIPDELLDQASNHLSQRALVFLEREIPTFMNMLSIHDTIFTKINLFSLKEIEKIILLIIKKHLKWINIFGAILGALIGCMQYFV